jgi:delta24-sterol reductase
MHHYTHQKAVEVIARQVRTFYDKKQPFRVYRGGTNSTRMVRFEKDKLVDVSRLTHVLSVDPAAKLAIVEPNVPMDKLVRATLKYGLIPPVVMEFPGITVGGGLQGGAGESSSYKWGTFNRTLDWYDLMLATGEVLRASRQEHADLF